MAGSTVSPYLLRPPRTLEEVLGGRSCVVQLRSGQVKGRQLPLRRGALCEFAENERAHLPRDQANCPFLP